MNSVEALMAEADEVCRDEQMLTGPRLSYGLAVRPQLRRLHMAPYPERRQPRVPVASHGGG